MNNLIVGLKIKSYSSFADIAKIIREYQTYSFSEIKEKINNDDYLLCYDCADRIGVKKIISCYEKLITTHTEVSLYELDGRETTIEQMKKRNHMYDEVSEEIDADSEA